MKQGNRGLNVVFRLVVFATFIAALAGSVTFLIFGFKVSDSSYSSISAYQTLMNDSEGILANIITSSVCYFIMLGLAAVSAVLSLVCFKCTSAVASVFRSLFMIGLAVADGVFVSAVITAWKVMRFYNGETDLYSSIASNLLIGNDVFEEKYMAAIICMFITTFVYFIFMITSIVSLASKPGPKNMNYQQNMPYGQTMNTPNNFGQPQMNNAPYGQQPQMNNAPFGQQPQMNNAQFGQQPQMNNASFGQPVQQAAPQQPVQPQAQTQAAPKIVGYDTTTGAPIYENQQN